jgi:hypothetical protein
MDKYLSDYIKRTTEKLKEEQHKPHPPVTEHNDYEVWPEDQGDADHKRNPYSRV